MRDGRQWNCITFILTREMFVIHDLPDAIWFSCKCIYRKIDLYIKSEYLTLTYWHFEKKRERARERWREMYNSPYPDLNANKWTLYARQLFYLCCCQWFLTIKWCVYIWYIYFFFARARTTQTRWMWFLLLLCEKCESCFGNQNVKKTCKYCAKSNCCHTV